MWSTSRPWWERIPPRHVFYYRSAKHCNAYVLSWFFVFEKQDETYSFAYRRAAEAEAAALAFLPLRTAVPLSGMERGRSPSAATLRAPHSSLPVARRPCLRSYPFTYTDGQRFLADIDRRNLPFVERGLLCRSIQSRRVDSVIIGEADRCPTPECPRRVAFISARVHPGETPASFVAKGALDFLCGADPLAKRLRRMITFVVVPMLNPDGVFAGNYRTDTLGVDLNRQWESPSAALEPTLLACKARSASPESPIFLSSILPSAPSWRGAAQRSGALRPRFSRRASRLTPLCFAPYEFSQNLITKYASDPSVLLDFFVDIHAHSNARKGFFLCNPPKQREPAAFERAALLPRLMDARLRDFSLSACRFDADPLKARASAAPPCIFSRVHQPFLCVYRA